MQKWEYLIVEVWGDNIYAVGGVTKHPFARKKWTEQLPAFGDEGWELTAIRIGNQFVGLERNDVLVFKRPQP